MDDEVDSGDRGEDEDYIREGAAVVQEKDRPDDSGQADEVEVDPGMVRGEPGQAGVGIEPEDKQEHDGEGDGKVCKDGGNEEAREDSGRNRGALCSRRDEEPGYK